MPMMTGSKLGVSLNVPPSINTPRVTAVALSRLTVVRGSTGRSPVSSVVPPCAR